MAWWYVAEYSNSDTFIARVLSQQQVCELMVYVIVIRVGHGDTTDLFILGVGGLLGFWGWLLYSWKEGGGEGGRVWDLGYGCGGRGGFRV